MKHKHAYLQNFMPARDPSMTWQRLQNHSWQTSTRKLLRISAYVYPGNAQDANDALTGLLALMIMFQKALLHANGATGSQAQIHL